VKKPFIYLAFTTIYPFFIFGVEYGGISPSLSSTQLYSCARGVDSAERHFEARWHLMCRSRRPAELLHLRDDFLYSPLVITTATQHVD